jgi:cell division protein FtsN
MVNPKITSRDFKRTRSHGLQFDWARWKEFGAGLLVGLAVALGVLVYFQRSDAAKAADAGAKPQPRQAARATTESEEPAKSYDFYDMLPKFEVVVPEKDREVRNDRDTSVAKIERPGVYVLQAGSYRDVAEADRIRAQLKLQGVDASVQRVAVDEDVWHRVRIGPITELKELNRLRNKLRQADLDALTIRVGE